MPLWRGYRSCSAAAEHQATDLLNPSRAAHHFAGNLTVIEDDDAIGESDQLFQLFGYDQDGAAPAMGGAALYVLV